MQYIVINLLSLLKNAEIHKDAGDDVSGNKSVVCGTDTTVSVASGDVDTKQPTFKVENLLTTAPDDESKGLYWLGPEEKPGNFILDLGCEKRVNLVELVNTHNNQGKDRGSKDIEVSVSSDVTGNWSRVLKTQLADPTKKPDPQELQSFKYGSRLCRFVKFESSTYYGKGAGLQYFNVKGHVLYQKINISIQLFNLQNAKIYLLLVEIF